MSIVVAKHDDIERIALDLLAMREHSRYELKQKLVKKLGNSPMISVVLDELLVRGYQSDLRYAHAFIRYRVGKGYGERYIALALQQKQVDRAIVLQAFDELAVDWFDVALHCYQRRYGSDLVSDAKEKERRTRFMISRGFSFEHIKELLQM